MFVYRYTPEQHVSNRKGLKLCIYLFVFLGGEKNVKKFARALKYPEFKVNKIKMTKNNKKTT